MGIPIPEFKVLLYGPGLHAAGMRARARFTSGHLEAQGHGMSFKVPAGQLHLKTGGFDGQQWLIVWVDQEGTYSAMLQGEEALAEFIASAPPEIAPRLLKAQKLQAQSKRSFNLGMVLIGLLLLLPVLALGLFWANGDRLAQWAVSRISLEQEQQLGELAFAQVRPSLKLLEQGEALAAVDKIGQRLTAESLRRYRFHLAVDPAINAYALPGGHVVVNTGLLLAVDTAGEMAGILAHEISHVEQRHNLRHLLHDLGWRGVLGVALGDFSGGIWGDLAAHLGQMAYSRDLEREADQSALEVLRRAQVAPHGLETFFAKQASRIGSVSTWLSTHPADDQRLAALRAAISRQPIDDVTPLLVDWERVKVDL